MADCSLTALLGSSPTCTSRGGLPGVLRDGPRLGRCGPLGSEGLGLRHVGRGLGLRLDTTPGHVPRLRAVLAEGPVEVHAEALPGHALDAPPAQLETQVVGAKHAVWIIERLGLRVRVEGLAPVLVADNLEVSNAGRGQQDVDREEARGPWVAAHLLERPVAPRAREVVRPGGARGQRRPLRGLELPPGDRAPLAPDLEEHLVPVPGLTRFGGAPRERLQVRLCERLLVPARRVGQALDETLAALVTGKAATTIDDPRRCRPATCCLCAPLEVRIWPEDRGALLHLRHARVQHAVR
mmetsp:Transcript_9249/g.25890  ORF Transcript_9249/g.25890 Transcript_9249/m.25890 type:complete len:296 (-) Transcript_9249:2454-3341(-)